MAHKYFVNEGRGMSVHRSQNELIRDMEEKGARLSIVPTFLADLI